jgi:hypothetical protein
MTRIERINADQKICENPPNPRHPRAIKAFQPILSRLQGIATYEPH